MVTTRMVSNTANKRYTVIQYTLVTTLLIITTLQQVTGKQRTSPALSLNILST